MQNQFGRPAAACIVTQVKGWRRRPVWPSWVISGKTSPEIIFRIGTYVYVYVRTWSCELTGQYLISKSSWTEGRSPCHMNISGNAIFRVRKPSSRVIVNFVDATIITVIGNIHQNGYLLMNEYFVFWQSFKNWKDRMKPFI